MPKPPAGSTIRRVIEHLVENGDLDAHGLHADAECEAQAEQVEEELAPLIGALHRQAHPGERRQVMYCRLEPCRSLNVHYYPTIATA